MKRTSFRERFLRVAAVAVSAAMLAAAPGASAQTAYPDRAIKLVVPAAAGGSTDLLARLIGEYLQGEWNQPVVVQNIVGAGGNNGAAEVAKSGPDGYTVLIGTQGTNAVNMSLYDNMPYDTQTAFTPVTQVASFPVILVVNAALGIEDVKGFVDYAKSKEPGELSVGSAGVGTSQDLATQVFENAAGLDLTHIIYTGTPPIIPDLIAGRLQASFLDPVSLAPFMDSPDLKILGISTPERSPIWPDMPTIAEAAIPGFAAASWQGAFVPAGTPPEVVQKLYEGIAAALKSPKLVERFQQLGATAGGQDPEAFASFVESEIDRWAHIVKDANISLK